MTVSETFRDLTSQLDMPADSATVKRPFIFAELNDLLTAAAGEQIERLPAPALADPRSANYVAAMVELAAHLKRVFPPAWTSAIAPLERPMFAVPWLSMRAHLLLESPVPFRRRNIFIDSSIGARV
ncbi:MAG TPA: hypothetical protein VG297_21230 [Bryobacteraceae bacterium]|nr:hypothetical protein [Bryobacteraceae bacterium]